MNDQSVIKVGIVGLGTVGGGTFNILNRNVESIRLKTGKTIKVTHIGARRDNPNVNIAESSFANDIKISRDIFDVVKDAELDIVVELIGGTDVAREIVTQALKNGKHVVTANKALIALHGNELFALAKKNGKVLAFEAAVAGGIPIIKVLTEGLSANNISWLAGIINGTGNFILTEMKNKGRDFSEVLKEAQALGYAEADPSFDVEGIDAAHKLTILTSLAFSVPMNFSQVFTEGITEITQEDLQFADNFGYKIKHLGIARKTEKGIEARVHPTLVPNTNLLSKVDGVMNAVMVKGDAVGSTMYYGAGAGAEATGSAVCADIIDIARGDVGSKEISFGKKQNFVSIEDIRCAYYLRLEVNDQAGALASISKVLSKQNISIEGIYQQELPEEDTVVPVVIITQKVEEKAMNQAIKKIEALDCTHGKAKKIRIEHFKS